MPPTGPVQIHCRIFQPPKSSMQSGKAKTQGWVLEYEAETPRRAEPLMGWIAAGDTLNQVRLRFTTREDAVAFAEREGFAYSVEETPPHRVRPRNYGDNFRYVPFEPSKPAG
jgi:hypothetical protein